MDVAVYLFTGFLEAGKTKFITETMQDENFNDGQRNYLIMSCEEGKEEYDPLDFGSNVSFCSFFSAIYIMFSSTCPNRYINCAIVS